MRTKAQVASTLHAWRQRWGQACLDATARALFVPPPEGVRHVLIWRVGALGDGVCTVPALTALRRRWPEARFSLLTHNGDTGRTRLDHLLPKGWFEEVMDYTGRPMSEVWRWLRTRSFDLLVVLPPWGRSLHRHLRDMVFFRLTGIRCAIGWQYDPMPRPPQWCAPPGDLPTEEERLQLILRKHGIAALPVMPWLSPNDAARTRIDLVLAHHDVSPPFVVLAPGASRPWNRWPIERFAQVAKVFAERLAIVVAGGREDRPAGQLLHHTTGAIDLTGQLAPLETAALLARASLFIGNDSGPAHLARAVGCPAVVVSSAWEWPGRWFRAGDRLSVLRYDAMPCRWCHVGCEAASCIRAISVEAVVAAGQALLQRQQKKNPGGGVWSGTRGIGTGE